MTRSAKSRIEAESSVKGHHVEIELQGGVFVGPERVAGAGDLRSDLVGRTDPGGAVGDLVGSGRLPQFGDHPIITRVIRRNPSVEPVAGGVDDRAQIGIE